MTAPALAPVVPITVARGRPSHARLASLAEERDLAVMELLARHADYLSLMERVRPALRRLHLVCFEVGTTAMHALGQVEWELDRYGRQWQPEEDDAA